MRRGLRPGVAAIVGVGSLAAGGCGDARPPGVGPGISRELAEHRAATISDVRYELLLRLPASPEAPVAGQAFIEFTLSERGPVVLDFAGSRVPAPTLYTGGDEKKRNLFRVAPMALRDDADWESLEVVDGHLVIPERHVRRGRNGLLIRFWAGDGPLNRDEEFLYTLFVPDRAHEAFPCFDQPDIRARFALRLRLPEAWEAVSNTPGRRVGARELRFEETEPIPTYLFSFAAGRFQVEEAERAGRTIRFYHRETDTAKVARNLEAAFDLHGRALEWLEEYAGIPYPFGKFDFVAIPSFQYGGMEHPGAILYRAENLFLDESATKVQELGRASVIAHETAHMWFGDLVTMGWFDDVWMKEVFANFLAAKMVNPSFPEVDHELRFLLAHYPPAYAVDRTAGANPIRQELGNLDEAGSLYGAIIYQKAPIVMRQLELLVGERAMRDGLREYLEANAFGNASWPDLIEILDRRSEPDLVTWSRVWVEEPGRPTVELALGPPGAGATPPGAGTAPPGAGATPPGAMRSVTLSQSDPRDRELRWTQPLGVRSGGADRRAWASAEVLLDGERASVSLPAEAVRTGPDAGWLLANGDGVGYGYFPLDPGTRAFVLERLAEIPGAVPRAVAWLSLWDDLLEGKVAPRDVVEAALRALEREDEELIVARLLDDLGTIYWRFLPPGARRELAPRIEGLLWRRLAEAGSRTLKATWFDAYRSVALTPGAVDRLRRLWSGDLALSGLPLSERDRTEIALALAVREVEGWETILDRQREAIGNPDRRARFVFVRPAVDPDPAVRDSFFRSLAEPRNRRREPWVLEGVSWLHHPLRADPSIAYLRPSLELLEEIHRTGDIFFPKRWLDATLGGHGGPRAAEVVRGFLAERPDYPRRLREKILQSADLLFRAASSRAGPDDLRPPASADAARRRPRSRGSARGTGGC